MTRCHRSVDVAHTRLYTAESTVLAEQCAAIGINLAMLVLCILQSSSAPAYLELSGYSADTQLLQVKVRTNSGTDSSKGQELKH